MSITPEWMVGRVPTIDPATGRLPVEYVPEEIGAAVAHVDEVAGRASASASAAAESAGQAQQSAQWVGQTADQWNTFWAGKRAYDVFLRPLASPVPVVDPQPFVRAYPSESKWRK